MLGLDVFATAFLLTFLAEFGDKTQISLFTLSTSYDSHLKIFIGAALAFFVVMGITVAIGSAAHYLLPLSVIRIVSGAIFILVGLYALFRLEEKHGKAGVAWGKRDPLLSSFLLISLMEWGDKTQIAAISLAANYSPMPVFAGALSALLLVSAATIIFGKEVTKRIPERYVRLFSAFLSIAVGVYLLFF